MTTRREGELRRAVREAGAEGEASRARPGSRGPQPPRTRGESSRPDPRAEGASTGQGHDADGRGRGDGEQPGPGAEIEELRRALEERSEQYLRLAADFENFRRRKAQELSDRARYAGEEAVTALLPVLDNLHRAVEHLPEGEQRSGIEMVVREFDAALRRIGVEPVEGIGAPFDPSIHEAVGGRESDDVDRDTVVGELQRGYRLHDRLLRPALVQVAHPPSRPAQLGGGS